MPAPSACSGLKELVECPGVRSTVTCCAKTGRASISSARPVFNRFNTPARCTPGDLQMVGFMAKKLRQKEVPHCTSARQVPGQEIKKGKKVWARLPAVSGRRLIEN